MWSHPVPGAAFGRRLLCALACMLLSLAATAQTMRISDLAIESDAGNATVHLTGIIGGAEPTKALTLQTATGQETQLTVDGAGPNCSIAEAGWKDPDAASPPSGVVLPYGLLAFRTEHCSGGETATFTLTLPTPQADDTRYYKFGATPDQPAGHWYTLPAHVQGNQIRFDITDGGLGDDDLISNGAIVDDGGPALVGTGIPALGMWGQGVLLAMLAAAALGVLRKRSHHLLAKSPLLILLALIAIGLMRDAGDAIGSGTPPAGLRVKPVSLVFRVAEVGQQSPIQTVAITNQGSAPVHLGNLAAGADFPLTHDCPPDLQPGAVCTVSVRFVPQGEQPPQPTSATPLISSLQPASVKANGGSQTLRVIGAGFGAGTLVRINGTAMPTNVRDGGTLEATLPSSVIQPGTTLSVTAVRSDGLVSNPVLLPVDPANLPAPAEVQAPVFKETQFPSLLDRIGFLIEGDNPIQFSAKPGIVTLEDAAGLRGRVVTRDGNPLPGVTVSLHALPDYGATLTRPDGWFDLALNGGGEVTVNYRKTGYLPVQRKITPDRQDIAVLDEVVMIPYDPQVTLVEPGTSSAYQVARGTRTEDADGARQATLLFPPGVAATLRMPDGGGVPLPKFHVRATEFTVGPDGPKTMPGPLPETVGYTYAVELSVDEAVAVGAEHVEFDRPVPFYVENFLGFPVGEVIPLGWYDYRQAAWEAADNGRIVKVLAIEGGVAVLDVEGRGQAATAQELAGFGITNEELAALANTYSVGSELWRVQVTHFTPWDCNWPYGPPEDAEPPPDPYSDDMLPGDDEVDECDGCIINPYAQTMREFISVTGTPYRLYYSSAFSPGFQGGQVMRIQLTGAHPPASLLSIKLTVSVAGQVHRRTFSAAPNVSYDFSWDGSTSHGNFVAGRQRALVTVEYHYPRIYYAASEDFERAWAQVERVDPMSGRPIVLGSRGSSAFVLSRSATSALLGHDSSSLPSAMSIGQWSLSPHMSYQDGLIVRGDGTKREDPRFHPADKWVGLRDAVTENILLPSLDSRAYFEFSKDGYHLRTLDAAGGRVLAGFEYDAGGYIVGIVDSNGLRTVVERDGSHRPTAIVAPHGQRTELTTDSAGRLVRLENPAGEAWRMEYSAGGLLTALVRPGGQRAEYAYDSDGRLIRDSQPDGGGWRIEPRVSLSGEMSVDMTTGEGRSYRFGRGVDNGLLTTSRTDPAGLVTLTTHDRVFGNSRSFPSGEVVQEPPAPIVLNPKSEVGTLRTKLVTLPSGLTARSRSVTNPRPPIKSVDDLRWGNTGQVVATPGEATTIYRNRTAAAFQSGLMSGEARLDDAGRPVRVCVGPCNLTTFADTAVEYDGEGRPTRIVEDAPTYPFHRYRQTRLTYHPSGPGAGLLASVTDPLGRTESYEYDLADRLTTLTSPDGRQTRYTWDANGRLTGIYPPGRDVHLYEYTDRDDLAVYEPPEAGAAVTRYRYDRDRLLSQVILPDGSTRDYGRDAAGRLVELTAGTDRIAYAYDSVGRPVSDTSPDGIASTREYDGSFEIARAWGGPVSGRIDFALGEDLLPETRRINSGPPVAYSRYNGFPYEAGDARLAYTWGSGRPKSVTLGNTWTGFDWDHFLDLTRIEHRVSGTPLLTISLEHDGAGRIVAKHESRGGVPVAWRYAYDLAGRLVEVKFEDIVVARHSWDANGNRVEEAVGGATYAGTVDGQDRLTACGNRTYSYTVNGEVSEIACGGQVTRFGWDGFGHLKSATLPDGSQIDYLYDADGRRMGRKVNGNLTDGWLYESALRIAARTDGAGNVVQEYVHGLAANVPEYVIQNGERYRIMTDHLGSVRLVVDADTGEIVQEMEYDEWGRVLKDTSPGFQPFGFAGGLYDSLTGLVRFGARDYDSVSGRWLSKDPIGLAGGMNVYSYAAGDPVGQLDPLGLANTPYGGGVLGWGWGGGGGGGSGGGGIGGGGRYSPPPAVPSPTRGLPPSGPQNGVYQTPRGDIRVYDSQGRPIYDIHKGHSHDGLKPHSHNYDDGNLNQRDAYEVCPLY